MYISNYLKNLGIFLFSLTSIILLFLSFNKFPGQKIHLITLFIISNFYIFYSFSFSKLFIDKTLSVFLWLGFYYKLSITLITDSGLPEGRGNFSYLPRQYDELLIISYIGIISFIITSYLFHRFFKKFFFFDNEIFEKKILLKFYDKYKLIICFLFLILIISISTINFKLGFYQKGLLPKTEINLILGYFIKWMLLFGLTSISCLLIDYDIKKYNKISKTVIFLFFLELFSTYLSLLSRSLIFIGSAILVATYLNYESKIKEKKLHNSLVVNFFILFLIFSLSIVPINKIRHSSFVDQSFVVEKLIKNYDKNEKTNKLNDEMFLSILKNENKKDQFQKIIESEIEEEKKIELIKENLAPSNNQNLNIKEDLNKILSIIKNRFVGLDGVATVTSYPNKSIKLLINSLYEEYDPNEYSFYHKTFILPFEQKHLEGEKYLKTSKRHYGVILPGIISFLSYSGSKLILFLSIFIIMFGCCAMEITARVQSYNCVIFSSLVGYVLGYRLIHFGYLPKQTYLIICAVILTIISIKLVSLLVIRFYKQSD